MNDIEEYIFNRIEILEDNQRELVKKLQKVESQLRQYMLIKGPL